MFVVTLQPPHSPENQPLAPRDVTSRGERRDAWIAGSAIGHLAVRDQMDDTGVEAEAFARRRLDDGVQV
jgi:hypothetical protein